MEQWYSTQVLKASVADDLVFLAGVTADSVIATNASAGADDLKSYSKFYLEKAGVECSISSQIANNGPTVRWGFHFAKYRLFD